MIRKVNSYVIRTRQGRSQLLVFKHDCGIEKYPFQTPAGTVEDGEDFEPAARREIAEETGLVDVRLLRCLGSRRTWRTELGDCEDRRFYLYAAPESTHDSWEHVVAGSGMDCGMVFPCFWIDAIDIAKIVPLQAACLTPKLLPELF